MREHFRPALALLALFSLLCGVAYPLAVTGIAQLAFPAQAAGSLIEQEGKVIGSELIGQNFSQPGYFHGRPSAAGANGYDASVSSGSNLGPSSKALQDRIAASVAVLKAENPGAPVPAELVYASASGLDPDIAPATAQFQIPRIAVARGLSAMQLQALIDRHTRPRFIGLIGEPAVNVLALNRALDASAAAP
ncbi:MAG: potassium-transporting ATPase subunit KdpC [Stagnimonas sp.]|nr:potassium-transporting ATPase subunit KdpC [Stagnimonas sp.]